MAAQQQSLLNVQSNLANVIKNIESNLVTRIQRLENNVIDKIDDSYTVVVNWVYDPPSPQQLLNSYWHWAINLPKSCPRWASKAQNSCGMPWRGRPT